jgi:penicillin-binding protein 1C
MELLYPQNGFRIVLTKQLDGSIGRLILQAVHRRPSATIYWHLDREYIGNTVGNHQLPLIPSSGRHVLTLVDDEGNTISGNFTVEE